MSLTESHENAHARTPAEHASAGSADMVDVPPGTSPSDDGPQTPSRVLEQALVTADQLVAESQEKADSLMAATRAEADAILKDARTESDRIAAETGRLKDEQTAHLARERVTTLAGLEEERAALEAAIARLNQVKDDHREELRTHLQEQLRLLDAANPGPPGGVAH